jgi:hypothetical protein
MTSTRPCARCGAPITPHRLGRPAVYCSPRCRDRAYRRRKIERRRAEPKPQWAIDLGIWTEAEFCDWLESQGKLMTMDELAELIGGTYRRRPG